MPSPRKIQLDPELKRQFTVGLNLQSIRKKRGLTQQELADRVGVTRQAITSYEAEKVVIPSITLIDIALALNVSSDELLGLKKQSIIETPSSRRIMKRVAIIETLPESTKKHILKFIDDTIKANT
jgi:transcriptional regulator with XRE-family HTH domain